MTVIAIPNILKEKLGESAALALVELFNKVEESAKDRSIETVEERFEKRLAQVEARIIRWTFIFVFGQFWAIVGTLFAFFRK